MSRSRSGDVADHFKAETLTEGSLLDKLGAQSEMMWGFTMRLSHAYFHQSAVDIAQRSGKQVEDYAPRSTIGHHFRTHVNDQAQTLPT